MNFKKILLATLTVIAYTSCANKVKTNKENNPNVLLIYVDDLGYGDLSCYGSEIPTPNIDRLAKQGVRFTNFHVGSSVCTPSRFSLLTGNYPCRSKHGLETVIMPGDNKFIDSTEYTLPEYMKSIGYSTSLFGKWHLGGNKIKDMPLNHGFEKFVGHLGGCIDYFNHNYGGLYDDWFTDSIKTPEKGYATDLLTKHAINYLDTINKNKPFFMMLSYNSPHYGKTTCDSLKSHTLELSNYTQKDILFRNTLQVPTEYLNKVNFIKDEYRKYYAAMVVNLDDNIRLLIKELQNKGLYKNTIIWFISDNGGYSNSYHNHASNGQLRNQKASFYEGGIRIPAFCVWESNIKPNTVNNALVANIDVLPTLANICKFKLKTTIDGINIKSVFSNNNNNISRDLLFKMYDKKAFIRDNWKMINGNELYNLNEDISEKNNLAKEYPDKLKELNNAWDLLLNN